MLKKTIKWLEEHVDEAAKGIDLAVADMVKTTKEKKTRKEKKIEEPEHLLSPTAAALILIAVSIIVSIVVAWLLGAFSG